VSRARFLRPVSCLLSSVSCLLFIISCAPKALRLPAGAGTPFPEFASAYDEVTASCRGVRTFTASMGMSGKAGNTPLRGRIDAGFEAPGRVRLEGIPPFGKPVFILVANAGKGTLLLTREERVLRDAPPEQIVETMVGVALDPDDMRSVVSGCGLADGPPASGALITQGETEWLVTQHSAASTTYLVRRGGAWKLAAATRGPVTVSYTDDETGRPRIVDIRAESDGRITANIRLRLSDVDINTTLDPRTFTVEIPEAAVSITLDDLRRAGPLGGGR
jgi:outer membrane lipoprotein-sorting protein